MTARSCAKSAYANPCKPEYWRGSGKFVDPPDVRPDPAHERLDAAIMPGRVLVGDPGPDLRVLRESLAHRQGQWHERVGDYVRIWHKWGRREPRMLAEAFSRLARTRAHLRVLTAELARREPGQGSLL